MLRNPSPATDAPGERSRAMELNEARLISLIATGDRHAFETLYRNYFPRLTRFLGRMTRNAQTIEEIVNDTMLVVWQKSDTYDHSCKVSTWIFAIAYRKALKAIQFLDEPMDSDPDLYPAETVHEPEQEISHQQLQRTLETAFDAIPTEQRVVLVLTYYHGMGYAEIAKAMDCPVNTVKTRMFHARRRLKTLLSGKKEQA
jgi:RNA polymerase sigma factor (sigma-70 family)